MLGGRAHYHGGVVRLVGFFLAVFALLAVLRQVPIVASIVSVPFLGFWVSAALVSLAAAKGGALLVDRRRDADLVRRLGAVDTPHNRGKLGSHFLARGRWRRALAHLEAAAAGEPEVAEWHFRLGQARLARGDAAGARAALAAAVELEEGHAYGQALLRLAEAELAAQDAPASLATLERYERNHGPSPESAYRRGRALQRLGRKDEARAALGEVGELARTAARYQRREGASWLWRAFLARLST